MKKYTTILYLFFFVLFAFALQAQPFEVSVFPSNPDDTMDIMINGDFNFDSGECMLMDMSVDPQGNNIYATVSFGTGILSETCNSPQDFPLGLLAAGDYNFICEVVEFQFDPEAACYNIAQSQVVETVFSVTSTVAECSVNNVFAEAHACNGDNVFYVDIEFTVENPAGEGFQIVGNGQNYGTFIYGEPFYTFGPIEGNGQVLEFIIQDLGNIDCSDFTVLTAPVCELPLCSINDLFVEAYACGGDGNFDIDLGFFVSNGLNAGFELWVDDVLYEYFAEYPNNYITIPNFAVGEGQDIFITVVDNDNPDCFADYTFVAPICPVVCVIGEIITDPAECDGEGTYSLFLNFAYEGNTNEFFDVYSGDEFIGYYAYADLPVTIMDFPERVTSEYDIITICDNDNPDCCTTHEFMGLDCTVAECSVNNVFAEAHACNGDNVFYVDIEFTVENPGGEGFQIVGNGQNYGTFIYGEPFYTFGPIEGNGQVLEFIIQDLGNLDCSNFTTLTAPVCESATCIIDGLIIEPYTCNPDGIYHVDLAFTYENVGGIGFDVFINGNFHSFQTTYPDPFITIENFGLGGGETVVVSVNDNDNLDCAATYTFVEPNCVTPTCSISEVSLTATDCVEGQFYIEMDFVHDVNSGAFIVGGAGSGQYNYADLPIALGPFEGNGQGMFFEVVDSEFEDCFAVEDILAPTCLVGECIVENVVAIPTACEANATFFVEIFFTSDNPGLEGFQILGNGNNYGSFAYGEGSYMIGPLFGDGTTVYEFVIQDLQYPDCSAFTVIDPVDCTMNFGEISNIMLTPHDCDEEQAFMVELNFDYTNVSDEFSVMVNSISEGDFAYAGLPVMVGPYPGDGQTNYEFIISDPGANTSAGAELLALDCGFGTGLEEVGKGLKVKIFNPDFSEELHLRISEITNDAMQVRFFDAIGQLVYHNKSQQDADAYALDLANYAVGMYICELRIGEQRFVGKFMVQR